jgi:hypothetical protein
MRAGLLPLRRYYLGVLLEMRWCHLEKKSVATSTHIQRA